jgi:cephalosporin hydroxylase
MRELDANDIANEIIGIYIDKHPSDRSIYNVSDIQFHSSVQLDEELKRRFIEKYNEM